MGLSTVLVVVSIFFLHSRRLTLWYDETVQLSISHSTHPESLDSYRYSVDPVSVMHWNGQYNLDPGGYSLLLNLLSPLVKNRFFIYRIISIVFFIIGFSLLLSKVLPSGQARGGFTETLFWGSLYLMTVTALMVIPAFKVMPVKVIVQELPMYNIIPPGFSIRGYGLLVAITSSLLYAIDWFKTYVLRRFLIVALLITAGMTIRYDFYLFVAAYLLAVLSHAVIRGDFRRLCRFSGAWVVLLSVFVCAITVYIVSYSDQVGAYSTPLKPANLLRYYLDSPENIRFFVRDPRNILASLFFCILLIKSIRSGLTLLESVYVILFALNLGLSLIGYMPFNLRSYRCLSMNLVYDTLLLSLVFAAWNWLCGSSRVSFYSFPASKSKITGYAALVSLVISSGVLLNAYVRDGRDMFRTAMLDANVKCLGRTLDTARRTTVFLDGLALPDVNMFYEMRGKPLPDHDFSYMRMGRHNVWYRNKQAIEDGVKRHLFKVDAEYCYVPLLRPVDSTRREFEKYYHTTCSSVLFRKRPAMDRDAP